MADQSNLRERLEALIKDYGTTQAFVCKNTRIVKSELCRFMKKTVVLAPSQVQRLDRFLSEHGYN